MDELEVERARCILEIDLPRLWSSEEGHSRSVVAAGVLSCSTRFCKSLSGSSSPVPSYSTRC